MIKIIFTVLLTVVAFTALSCSGAGGVVDQTNTTYITNITGITNLSGAVISNTAAGYPDLGAMSNMEGQWLITFNIFLNVEQVYDVNSNLVWTWIQRTNYVGNLSNNGTNGAVTYTFKLDGTVDKTTYNAQGNIDTVVTNFYLFAAYTNAQAQWIELTDPLTVKETAWLEYDGYYLTTNVAVDVITVKTNYQQNYTITNIYPVTNSTTDILTNTNNVQLVRDLERSFLTYKYLFDDPTNISYYPNVVSNIVPSGLQKSGGSIREVISSGTNGSGSYNATVSFDPNSFNEMKLLKIN